MRSYLISRYHDHPGSTVQYLIVVEALAFQDWPAKKKRKEKLLSKRPLHAVSDLSVLRHTPDVPLCYATRHAMFTHLLSFCTSNVPSKNLVLRGPAPWRCLFFFFGTFFLVAQQGGNTCSNVISPLPQCESNATKVQYKPLARPKTGHPPFPFTPKVGPSYFLGL